MAKLSIFAVLIATAVLTQGCLATAAVKTTGAVVKTTAKGVGAAGRAVIPGDSRDDKDRR